MREIVLGNGAMMLNFDQDLNLRDLYWPYGGFENHGDANRSGFGIFADQRLSWVFTSDWEKKITHIENTPITNIKAVNHHLGLELLINDALHWSEDLYLRKIVVRNLREYAREVKLIFYQDLSIKGIEAGDSAVYDPHTGGIYHYKKNCYLLANCMTSYGGTEEYSTGVKRYRGREGTYKDAEDGYLSRNPVADGPVDSVLGVTVEIPAKKTESVYYWLVAGYSLQDIRTLNQRFLSRPAETWLQDMIGHYRCWIKRAERDYMDLTPRQVALFKHSLFTIKSQIDRRGAVVASPDADTFMVARDHYMYLWPRDGAMVAHALDLAGYPEEARRVYSFFARIIDNEGYFLQRYNPDGTPGCTWHPRIFKGEPVPPIQEDETALVIWALGQHFKMYKDVALVSRLYMPLIKPALEFMSSYIDPETGLPSPSWDLWEERRGIFSFTCGAVYGALAEGVLMAEVVGDGLTAEKCRLTATQLRSSIIKHLYHQGWNRFIRGLYHNEKGQLMPDPTIDVSLYGLFAFGALDPQDERIERTMSAVRKELWAKTGVGGVARYTNDYYYRVSDDIENVPGNPWILTTLWVADWYIARAKQPDDLARAKELIEWAAQQAGNGLLLPEQVHPYDGTPLSVCPLTWSHSTLVKVMVDYLKKKESMGLN